jgi:hypothetical protein
VEYLGVPLAVLTMIAAQRVELRLGGAAAGWFAALPLSMAVAGASIAVTGSSADASDMAISAVAHLGPMMAYATAFVWCAPRRGAAPAVGVGALAYLAASLLVVEIPVRERVLLGALAIALATGFAHRNAHAVTPGQVAPRSQQLASVASAGVVVGVITAANQQFGPELAGAVGAFPAMTTTIALFVAGRSGAGAATAVMGGLVRSVPIYLLYCLSFAFLVLHVAVAVAVLVSLAVALLTAALTWRRVEIAQSPLVHA